MLVPMRDAYQASAKLFSYVWTPSSFMNDSYEKEISSLINRLVKDFHKIESDSKDQDDPGFAVALNAQNRLLADAYERFNEGKKEYAWWKLKGLTHNCAACHSRFSSRMDFLGVHASGDDTSFEAKLAASEFLIASRQFSRASRELLKLTESVSGLKGGGTYALQALRLWLMVEVRVQESFHGAASELSRIKDTENLTEEQKHLLSSWIVHLQELQSMKPFFEDTSVISHVRDLLGSLTEERTLSQDDIDLVKTARASSLLHSLSFEELSSAGKREALLLLGVSYQRNTVPGFKDLAPMFFEQCIRQFPHTPEAKMSYELFEREFQMLHTGSGGEYVSDDEQKLLDKLKALAVKE